MTSHKLLPLVVSPGVAAFLSCVDRVKVERTFPTSATAIIKGKLTLILGKAYLAAEDDVSRNEFLLHEASHFYNATLARFPDKPARGWQKSMSHEEREALQQNALLWNLVMDAAQHGLGGCHQDDPDVITWERLKLSPMSPEMAYAILKERVAQGKNPDGSEQGNSPSPCGTCMHSQDDGTTESFLKGLETQGKMESSGEFKNRDRMGGTGRGEGAYVEASPPPSWIRETLDYLLSRRGDERRRSWRRENRCHRDLPGRSAVSGYAGLFLIDASGSISDVELGMFLGAVMSTPELKNSQCAVFDHEVSPTAPVSQAQELLKQYGRGGTDFGPPAALRVPGETAVWLTDGYPCGPWPDEHDGPELWCITTDVRPPHGVRIQASAL